MKKPVILLYTLIFLIACAEKPMEKLGNVTFERNGKVCKTTNKNHWLIDLVARNAKDSIYLNTDALGRKIEVHKRQLDSNSTLFSLLEETCKNDSLRIHLTAQEFYSSMNGSVPTYLKKNEQIKIKLWMRDKLTDIEHIAYKKVYENDAIRRYTEKMRWNSIRDSATGIVYEQLKKIESSPKDIKKAKVNYVIRSLNEKLIAKSDEDMLLIYDIEDQNILGGIRFLISKLGAGESARAVVPSEMGYGADGNSRVPGYMPLLIEVEIKEILE